MADYATDTHGLIWALENDPHLGSQARQAFSQCDRGEITIYVPTICLVEMVYLQEKGRIAPDLIARFNAALAMGNTGLSVADLTSEIVAALPTVPRIQVPDMPDRIIAATALSLGVSLISVDHKIQLSQVNTIW